LYRSKRGDLELRLLPSRAKDSAISPRFGNRYRGLAVIFQDVVRSIGTGEADCDEQSSFPGQTEWTSTRMPDSPFAVERRWSKPSFAKTPNEWGTRMSPDLSQRKAVSFFSSQSLCDGHHISFLRAMRESHADRVVLKRTAVHRGTFQNFFCFQGRTTAKCNPNPRITGLPLHFECVLRFVPSQCEGGIL
jgi:hypothetical protein